MVSMWLRVAIGGSYFYYGFLNGIYLSQTTFHNARNGKITNTVLAVNCLTMTTLGMAVIIGGWRTGADFSIGMSNAFLPLFSGSSTATDFLLSCRWSEIKTEKFAGYFKDTLALRLWRFRVFVFAIVMITFDWSVIIVLPFVTSNMLNTVSFIYTGGFIVLQIVITTYMVVQVIGMVRMISSVLRIVEQYEHKEKCALAKSQKKNLSKITFWVAVSAAGSCLTIAGWLLIAMYTYAQTCELWIIVWSMLFVGKLASVVAQTKVCKPMRPKFRVSSESSH